MKPQFKLKDIKKNRLVIFDLDDTLVKTDAKIKILHHKTRKVIGELTPSEFNNFKKKSGHILNFDDFEDAEILSQARFIHSIFRKLKYYYRMGIPVSIVTARSSSEMVRDFFLSHSIDIHPDLVIAINDPDEDLSGNIAERKKMAIRRLIDDGYTDLIFFDDNEDNLRLAKDLIGYKNSKIKLVKVV
jgi:hypothetical protein